MFHRGDSGLTFGLKGKSINELKGMIGGTINVKTYVSTSIDSGYALPFRYNIYVKKGKGKGAYIAGISNIPQEYEFLIKRGSNFKVQGVKKEGDNVLVDLELL